MEKKHLRTPKQLILASSSASRQKQLARLGLSFRSKAPEIDETPLPEENAATLVQRLSVAKAKTVATYHPDSLIISGDQTAQFGDGFLHKPETRANAIEQLTYLQGNEVEFISGLCVLDTSSDTAFYEAARCLVKFRKLTPKQIDTYIDLDEPIFCAGSFKCEQAGIALFEYIKSDDPSAITGMPLITLVTLLEKHGFSIFANA